MKLWKCDHWDLYLYQDRRTGVRLRFDKGVDPEVRRACLTFVQWMRKNFDFPIRIPIYLKNKEFIVSNQGEQASAAFFGPYDKRFEPYIRISVGDYKTLLKSRGKDRALAAILHSVAHELSHYYQWIKDTLDDPRAERQARYYARRVLDIYAQTREHP